MKNTNTFHLLGFFLVYKGTKTLFCVSCKVEPGPCPKASLLFLDCSSFVSTSLSSLISSCLDLPFGTQGRSWRLDSIPNKQEMGDTDKFPCPGSPQVTLSFNIKLEKETNMIISRFCLSK